ncbi:hypothetical protein BHM03_00061227 [Ensete ventricosum]|nr:hypothetical protein BHM03_00061227 [Ensete ventricosum]
MAAAKECSETLKYQAKFWILVVLQTSILKVSIHCEGCKKKVKKVLQSMEGNLGSSSGVYKTTVDPQQHKVVVTGNVAAEILIKRLLKAGKHAELWPETKPMETGGGGGSNAGSNNNKKSKNNKPIEPSENIDNSQVSNGKDDSTQVSDKPESEASKNGSKEPPPPPEKEDEGNKSAATQGGGKKKGKKCQKENSNSSNDNKSGSASGGGGATEVEVAPQEASKKAGEGGGVAIPPTFNFPVYTTSQLPSYLVSYNSMQPSMSHGGAYYTALPMLQSSYIYSTASPCSCYTCSDENSSACSIM